MSTILVTGGCGYIGSHTITDLVENGYDVVCADNNMRSTTQLLDAVEKITGKKIPFVFTDLCKIEEVRALFAAHRFDGIIHFAALKSVDESVKDPALYFYNNLASQVNVLKCTEEFAVPFFVFSSSCSVYGNVSDLPVTEDTILAKAESPYGLTKQMGEQIIRNTSPASKTKFILLRYFNPAGAHPSGHIGEVPFGRPSNLVPAITQFAAGKIPALTVFGTDYDTRDGSCIRDFIHVSDIAHAHTMAFKFLTTVTDGHYCDVFNLGTGNGITVLETIQAFEKVSGLQLDYKTAGRREGDVVAVYASNEKAAKTLGWKPQYTIEDIMRTAWAWEQRMATQ
ncbi:MAG: UDP-glucose 4-epimerase GalE [Bacteroidetes bacterium]|nr:UDP-glucose 4-epimerase GalE [Bacteroidota bacterium]